MVTGVLSRAYSRPVGTFLGTLEWPVPMLDRGRNSGRDRVPVVLETILVFVPRRSASFSADWPEALNKLVAVLP